jgi:hypothetical protein
MAQQAQDTFVTEIDGSPVTIQKGAVLPDRHAVVRRVAGSGLFSQLDMDDPAEVKRSRPSRARPKAGGADAGADDAAGDDG